MIDLSKLPPPQLIEELNYEVILTEMRKKLREQLPEWTGYELESDPANKVLEVAAYREMLLRQRVNEAARGVMVAFARGSDLDHLAAFYPEQRLPGAAATFMATMKLSAALEVEVTIPEGYTIIAKAGKIEARLMQTLAIMSGGLSVDGRFEIVRPIGNEANGLELAWDAITPLPFVVSVEQKEPSHGGSDTESDEDFRRRIPLALERYSTAGPRGSYEYWAYTADERVKGVCVTSPVPGEVEVYLLSSEGEGQADEAMVSRVDNILNAEKVRPLTDHVTVMSASIVRYRVVANIIVYEGVAGAEPLAEAEKQLREKVKDLHGVGYDIPRSALISAAHVEGVKTVELLEPAADLHILDCEAAFCERVTIGSRVANEP